MTSPTLKDRLQGELIGEDQKESVIDPGNMSGMVTIGEEANELRSDQRDELDEVISHIAADVEGLIPPEKPAAASVYAPHYRDNRQHDCDYTLQVQLNNELNKGYNQAIEDVKAALARYTKGE